MCWSAADPGRRRGPRPARCGRSLARSAETTTSAWPPSVSWQQSSSRSGSAIQPRRLVVGERDRPAVEPGLRVGRRVRPVDDGDPAEVLGRRAVLVHVAVGEHRHPLRRRGQAERRHPAVRRAVGAGVHGPAGLAEAVALTGALVEGTPAHHDRRRVRRWMAAAACATVPHAAPPPWPTREKNVRSPIPTLRATWISELDSAVNVTIPSTSDGVEAGVVECRADGLARQLQLAAAGRLGELGGTDADDRGRAARARSCGRHRAARRSRSR